LSLNETVPNTWHLLARRIKHPHAYSPNKSKGEYDVPKRERADQRCCNNLEGSHKLLFGFLLLSNKNSHRARPRDCAAMEKLRDYFAKRKESTDDLNGADGDEPVAFPTLDPQEEEQVYKTLGIDENKVQGKNAKDVILGTLRSLKQVKVAGAENAEAAGTTSDESEAETELVGTVRIKSNGGSDKFGTLRRNKKNELLLEELSNMSTDDSSEDAYGTFKINNDYSSDDSYGTMKISDIASDDRPSWMSKSSVRLFSLLCSFALHLRCIASGPFYYSLGCCGLHSVPERTRALHMYFAV
jgi:hypothetical protein